MKTVNPPTRPVVSAGQKDFLARVACKDYGLVAAETGCGKSLMAISLVQVKAPYRALIIAPLGTMKEQEDDEGHRDAAQWLEELEKFAPGIPVHRLFCAEDAERLLREHGTMPPGIYVTYYQAWLQNEGARESCPKSWTSIKEPGDKKMQAHLDKQFPDSGYVVPKPPADSTEPANHWAKSIGEEHEGIRCILTPSLCSRFGHLFEMVCIDEAHAAAKLDSNTTQILVRMQPRYRFAFTATPIPNVVSNIFPLLGWLAVPGWFKGNRRSAAWPYAREDLGKFENAFLTKERDFTQESINARNDNYGKVEKASPVISNPTLLLKYLTPTLAFIDKQTCNPDYLPATRKDIRVPLGKQQAALYQFFLNRGNITHGNALRRASLQMGCLREITADPADFHTKWGRRSDPDTGFIGWDQLKPRTNVNPKTLAVMGLIADCLERGEPVLVMASRTKQSDTYARLLSQCGIEFARIDSTMDAAGHAAQAARFKAAKVPVCLMGVKCAQAYSFGMVPNLIIASIEYYPGPLEQAQGRIDRVNSAVRPNHPEARTLYCVLTRQTIEETMYDTCATKADSAAICLRGRRVPRDFKPIDASEVLALSIEAFQGLSVPEEDCHAQLNPILERLKQLG